MNYNLIAELPVRELDADHVDQLLDDLSDFHPAIARSPLGWLEVTLTVPAETPRQAVATGLAVLGREPVSLTVMRTEEFDRRPVGVERVPDLLSVTEVAERLGVNRQAVLQQIDAGRLHAVRVGATWALPAAQFN